MLFIGGFRDCLIQEKSKKLEKSLVIPKQIFMKT